MAYAAHPSDFTHHDQTRTQVHVPAKRGLLRRLYQSFQASRQKQADRQIAAFLARSGGRFTDSVERELSTRMFMGDWERRSPSTGFL